MKGKIFVKYLLATNNLHKVEEFKKIFENTNIKLLSLTDFDKVKEPIEDGLTFKDNSFIKAKYYFDLFRIPTIADDSGLIAFELGDLPGVYSARFCKLYPEKQFDNNTLLLLDLLKNNPNRKAAFVCDICLYDGNNPLHFEGRCEGDLTTDLRGNKGFGYDPIFIPNGYELTFAEMEEDEKNRISHRGIASKKLFEHINK